MDLLHELENLAVIAEANIKHQGPFENLLQTPQTKKTLTPQTQPQSQDLKSTYLVKLEGPLPTALAIQKLAGTHRLPRQITGTGDISGEASFCFINGAEREAIAAALPATFKPTFIHINGTDKNLDTDSAAPCLGYNATLPHHRADNPNQIFRPAQNEYPIWYFFYGTLSRPEILVEKLGLSASPGLRPATVKGGIRSWGGKYNALVDGDGAVSGWAYRVSCAGHEEILRCYESSAYEVVRCGILMGDTGETVWELTFRFVGCEG